MVEVYACVNDGTFTATDYPLDFNDYLILGNITLVLLNVTNVNCMAII